jgi:uncharacterized membrane protein YeaQ/YmgE (transglycosylase-associated protein family)
MIAKTVKLARNDEIAVDFNNRQAIAWAVIGSWLWKLIKYGPVVYKVVKKIIEYIKGSTATTEGTNLEGQQAELKSASSSDEVLGVIGQVVDVIGKIIGYGREALSSEYADLVDDLLKLFGLGPEEVDQLKEKLDGVLASLQQFIEEVGPMIPKTENEPESADYTLGEEEYSIAMADIDRIVEGKCLEINSGLYSIKSGSEYYSGIESAMKKVAEYNNIDNVEEIEIQISKEGMVAVFRKDRTAAAFENVDFVAGLSAMGADRLLNMFADPENQSGWGETAVKGFLAGATNVGFTAGMSIAKVMGAGTLMQIVAGGVGAIAVYMLTHMGSEEEKDSFDQVMADPSKAEKLKAYAAEKGIDIRDAWKDYLLLMKDQM